MPSHNKTVFVFGAGATRGASFVKEKDGACHPPLDGDFYSQLQRLDRQKHGLIVGNVIEDTVNFFGVNFTVTLESVFTSLEQSVRLIKLVGDSPKHKLRDLQQMKIHLLQAIAAVFEASMLEPEAKREPKLCSYHVNVIEEMRETDTIISYNYDCLIDQTLKNVGDRKWNPRYGYGFNLGSRGRNLTGDEYWSPGKPAAREHTLTVLKLHGSLHFLEEPRSKVKLKQRPYTRQNGNLKFTIIPPEWNKAYDEGIFANIWRRAGKAIHAASTLVFIGYSFPETDLHAASLFRVNLCDESLKSLVIVNPDRKARYRTREVLRRGMSPLTKVVVFDSLEEFSKVKRASWQPA